MKVIDFSKDNSLINRYVEELRDVNIQKDSMRFRRNIERIGELIAYEISKTLDYSVKKVQTPLGVAEVSTHDDKIVVSTVFRAGLPMHMGFLNMFDNAENAFVSAFRSFKDVAHEEMEVSIDYIAAPSLQDKTILLVDPMLATGESIGLAWEALKTRGIPKKLHLACIVASEQGVARLSELFPQDDIILWCGVIDPSLNEDNYIVPGLGDAGDLCYGEKI